MPNVSSEGDSNTPKAPDPKFLLDYLDREMATLQTLLAFLSSVLAISLGLVAKNGEEIARVIGHTRDMWRLIASAGLVIASTYLFFQQREKLALISWQISLAASGYDPNLKVSEEWKAADSWTTWLQYRWGWKALFAAFIEIGSIIFRSLSKNPAKGVLPRWDSWLAYGADGAVVLIVIWGALQTLVFYKWPFSDDAMAEFFKVLKRKFGPL